MAEWVEHPPPVLVDYGIPTHKFEPALRPINDLKKKNTCSYTA